MNSISDVTHSAAARTGRLLAGPCFGALVLLLVPGIASAQTATINVTVIDEAGEAQTFTDVNVEGEDGNPHSDSSLTDEQGKARFVAVPAGKYKVSAFSEGLFSDTYKIELGPGAVQDMRIVLKKFMAQEQTVDIDYRVAELVDVKEVITATEFTGEFINKIPIQNRRIEDIVAMMPGVIRVGSSDSTDISIGGGTSSQIAYRIDGLSGNDPIDGGLTLQVPTAAIQSFRLITSGASAKYGEQSTGIAEIVTKAGGNENDFTYEVQFRDTDYGAQAIDGMDEANQAVHDLLTAAGSPLQQELESGMRLLGVDPISTLDDDNNPTPRARIRHTVSAGGPIKKDEAFFHTTLEMLRDDYGSPFVDGVGKNDQLLWTSKVNWTLFRNESTGADNRLEFTANLDVRDGSGFAGLRATRSLNTLPTSGAWTLGVTDTHVFSNLGVLESKLSFSHKYETNRPEDVRTGVGTTYTIPLPPGGPTSYFVGAPGADFDETVSTIRLETNYAKAIGRRQQHTFDFGFNADQTYFKSFAEAGPDVSDFRVLDDTTLLGSNPFVPIGRERTYGPPVKTDDSAYYVALYASDNWAVTDNFYLQTGIRAEYQSFIGKVFLAPRIGFSLDPIGDGRTRFFGNWGIYYDRLFANFLQYTQNPNQYWSDIWFFPQYTQRNFSDISIVDVYKDALTRLPTSTASGAIAWLEPTIEDRFVGAADVTAPTNKDWTIGISRQLPGNVRLEVTYRSNKRTHQITNDAFVRSEAVNAGQRQVRDIVYGTTGNGRFRQWAVEVGRPFAKLWSMNLSYVQSRNYGPVGPPLDPIDPNDVFFVNGIQDNDRTHVVKLQGNTKIGKGKAAVDTSLDFTWQSGSPVTASLYRNNGFRFEPLGRNSLRLPSTRQLNLGLSKSFQLNTKEGGGFLPTIGFRAQLFNVLNELNVTGALARFELPPGVSNPQSFPPLRPDLVTTSVDVSRSIEVGFSVSF